MKTILLVIALVAKADAPKADLPTVAAASAAVAAVTVVGEVAPGSAALPSVTVVSEVPATTAAVSSAVGLCPFAAAAAGCAPVDLYRGDAGFLSGPWGAAWRLEAARKRGDSAAARQLETTLDDLLAKALDAGE